MAKLDRGALSCLNYSIEIGMIRGSRSRNTLSDLYKMVYNHLKCDYQANLHIEESSPRHIASALEIDHHLDILK